MLASDYRNGTWCSEEFICSNIHPADLFTSSEQLPSGVNPMIQVYPVTPSMVPDIHHSCPRLHLFANLYVRKRKSVIIHTPSLAWNVNRMAYNEGGQKMHGRKKGLRMLTYDGEDYKQNKAHKEAVSCN